MKTSPLTLMHGCCLQQLMLLAEKSIGCCVTSPPYWMLRDYGIPASEWPAIEFVPMAGLPPITIAAMRCQLGLEADPWAFVGHMVHVFRLVRRALRPDGTLWMNLGDSYAADGKNRTVEQATAKCTLVGSPNGNAAILKQGTKINGGLKKKDLCGMPWRVALALQADGWYLRRDIIWHKPNPMPESTRDRPTTSHEYIFLLSKSPKYFYDGAAIAEPCSENTHARIAQNVADQAGSNRANGGSRDERPMKAVVAPVLMPPIGGRKHVANKTTPRHSGNTPAFQVAGLNPKAAAVVPGDHKMRPKQNASMSAALVNPVCVRNSRSVWKISTEAYRGDHFATFPRELAARCIKAGCAAGGKVLDPFGGTGTVAAEAILLGRRAVSIEINAKDIRNSQKRVAELCPLFAGGEA